MKCCALYRVEGWVQPYSGTGRIRAFHAANCPTFVAEIRRVLIAWGDADASAADARIEIVRALASGSGREFTLVKAKPVRPPV